MPGYEGGKAIGIKAKDEGLLLRFFDVARSGREERVEVVNGCRAGNTYAG
jgi:hypothetical protein